MGKGISPDEAKSRGELCLELERLRRRLADLEAAGGSHEERRRQLEARLFRQSAALVGLGRSGELAQGDFNGFARLATRVAAETLDVARVSIWLFNEDRSVLRCEQLYERPSDRVSAGTELRAGRYPRYFAALKRGRRVAAHDAHQDPDTSEFSEEYLTPLGINSMLDAPFRSLGELIGVVCHEHVGRPRVWAPEEQDFASSVADFVSLVLESRERKRAERAFRSTQEDLLRQQWQATKQVESELTKARGELVRQTRLATIGQVAASIAHELRNPLGAIHNATYYLSQRVPRSEPKWAEYLEIIEEEIRAADGILGDLLEMSKAKQPIRENVNLADALGDAMKYAQVRDRVRLELDLTPDPFMVRADPRQLRQVLSNLLLNAAQAMGQAGLVHVRARMEDGTACITLRDDGPGVPAERRDQIFEPLFTSRAKGTGLGLPICRQILERHGGSIVLDEGDGEGAAFLLRIPHVTEREHVLEG
jgi:signal transduction histidine kinase